MKIKERKLRNTLMLQGVVAVMQRSEDRVAELLAQVDDRDETINQLKKELAKRPPKGNPQLLSESRERWKKTAAINLAKLKRVRDALGAKKLLGRKAILTILEE